LIFIAKNGLIAGIDYNPSRGLYFWFSIATLITSLGLRAFIDIQNECFSDFKQERENQQNDFNKGFINSLQKNGN
jgi:hypothetical protein